MSHTSPPSSKTRRENEKGLVTDREGRYYVALHPIYSSTASRRHCVLACRLVVCLLSFLVFLFTIIGQVVPFAHQWDKKDDEKETYSAWQVKQYEDGKLDDVGDNKRTGGAKACAILTVRLALVALILSAIFAAFWSRDEKIRFDEEDDNERLQAKYGVERSDADSNTSFPYENARIANDCVDEVPFEEAERKRLLLDRNMGIAVFALLIGTALFALITLILMASFYNKRVAKKDGAKYREGLALFIVSLVLAVIAFVVVAIPPASALNMCGEPRVRRADLMVLSPSQPAPPPHPHNSEVPTQMARRDGAGSGSDPRASSHGKAKSRTGGYEQQYDTEQRQHQSLPPPPPAQTQPAPNPYYPPGAMENGGMAVAQGIPMALPGPSMEVLQQQQQQQQQPEYASGAYYQAPPQLFNVGKGGKGKAL